ncbi:peptidylprolyl isomerase [Clostridium botulinum]|uniref:Foldase protein PrsA n=1 Tax=Clostridium botulinum (strain Okra / Type B1) TaxID=498213 RepID=PRSA_CLOBK|nr:peptidylprolyl isomerase [Clostridium botulinum]B1IGZ5.1 RecName: Full=Foldase protein PrsA; Flags: Precursor [Clostridium botulinum B1 str. Okra]ACA45212.1 putative peptidyl-prolyl cis-trans isomerase [Clostridium botulinum B1 str. Okra]MBD5563243.1 peptidylprolyl isomerase [Clostridium botulinum]MBD5568214.1 peptidylprolyl isomerase [Clostridium botulinum]MBD5571944.1 peptidylprolyl isomerase [Clostridium botulinum]MBD5575704.1 peptidylprolyl isomerase [Clostridium botulinum]
MKSAKKLLSVLCLGIFILTFTACDMVEKTPEAKAKSTIAKVNGEKIQRKDLDESPSMQQVLSQIKTQYGEEFEKSEQGKEVIKEQKKQILENLITEKVLLQKGKELKVIPKDEELNKEADKKVNEIKAVYNNDEKKFEETLKSTGFTKETLKEYLKDQIVIEKVINEVTKDVKVEDKDAQKYYNENQSMFTEKPNTMNVSHILVKTEDEAKKVKKRLDAKEDFAKVAKEVSQDTGSKDKGGLLGDISYSDSNFDPTFMKAAIALKSGAISNPVHTQFGYHIIKINSKKEYPVKKFDSVKEDIKKQLKQEKQQEAYTKKIEEWKKASKIKTYEKNLL